MEERFVEYLSYLLRLWRTSKESPWRASLEDPQTGERRGFGSLEALFAFLREQTLPAPDLLDDVEPDEGEAAGGVTYA